jgi:hypothetical protein
MGTSSVTLRILLHRGLATSLLALSLILPSPLAASDHSLRQDSALSHLGSPLSGADNWWEGFAGTSVNGDVDAVIEYGGYWIIGGTFTGAGGVVGTQGLARWAGSQWVSMSPPGLAFTQALAEHQGELHVGGVILTSGGAPSNGVMKWNGSSWSGLGTGISGVVNALQSDGTDLIAGGEFTSAGGTTVSNVARWNGTSWSAMGGGISGAVNALVEYNGQIFAGGDFDMPGGIEGIARWNGSSWDDVGGGVGGDVLALTTYQGDLIAGGTFTGAGGRNGEPFVARWTGSSWASLGSGIGGWVGALAVHDGKLYVGGGFVEAGGAPASRIACWDGSSWTVLDSGITGGTASSIASNGFDILVGGYFGFAGGNEAVNLARWNGSAWSGDMSSSGNGLGGDGWSLTTHGGDLIVGGAFQSAGGQAASRIVRWDGTNWHPMGIGFNSTVLAYTSYNGDLIAAGFFTHTGTTVVNHIARWDGAQWQPLGSGINGPVYDVVAFDGDLYAGGQFTSAGGVSANNIARWNGSTWQDVGGGITSLPGNLPQVRALAVHNGVLAVGGGFDLAGGALHRTAASWNGTVWAGMGSGYWGFSETTMIKDFVVWGDVLVAGGDFTQADNIPSNRYVAQWNGFGWGSVGDVDEVVSSVAICDSVLLVGAEDNVRYWNGSDWDTLGGGMTAPDNDIAVHQGQLFVTGSFTGAGNTPSGHIASWGNQQVGIVTPPIPVAFSAFPNPFRAGSTVTYELEAPGRVRLSVFDVRGRRLAVISDGVEGVGRHERTWDGKNDLGLRVPAGTYYLLLETPGARGTRKLTRIR